MSISKPKFDQNKEKKSKIRNLPLSDTILSKLDKKLTRFMGSGGPFSYKNCVFSSKFASNYLLFCIIQTD